MVMSSRSRVEENKKKSRWGASQCSLTLFEDSSSGVFFCRAMNTAFTWAIGDIIKSKVMVLVLPIT